MSSRKSQQRKVSKIIGQLEIVDQILANIIFVFERDVEILNLANNIAEDLSQLTKKIKRKL